MAAEPIATQPILVSGGNRPKAETQDWATQTRAKQLAEKMLKSRMFQKSSLYTAPVAALMDNTKYQSHGQMIGINEAKGISLNLDSRTPDDPLWWKFWQLYRYQRMGIEDDTKLFESDVASLMS